jgi:hypothetical protein
MEDAYSKMSSAVSDNVRRPQSPTVENSSSIVRSAGAVLDSSLPFNSPAPALVLGTVGRTSFLKKGIMRTSSDGDSHT